MTLGQAHNTQERAAICLYLQCESINLWPILPSIGGQSLGGREGGKVGQSDFQFTISILASNCGKSYNLLVVSNWEGGKVGAI